MAPHLHHLSSQLAGTSPGRIAFVSNRDGNPGIYVMLPDGTGVTRLTDNATDGNPAWSPDGLKIAFSSSRDGLSHIYVMNADGSSVTRLTSDAGRDFDPHWSPDGRHIAFVSDRDDQPQGFSAQVYVMNADGSGQTRLTSLLDRKRYPVWSPDGTRIVFWEQAGGNEWIMNADGSALRQLPINLPLISPVAWAPDGAHLVVPTDGSSDGIDLYLISVDGPYSITRLTSSPANDFPTFSPDGSRIAFESGRDGNWEIYVMNADGSGQTRLTNNTFSDADPSWGPAPVPATVTLAFTAQPPASVEGEAVMSPVQVAMQDATGATIATGSGAVTLTLSANAAGATLLGTTTVDAVNGVATFSDLRVDRPGTGFTLTAAAANASPATSSAFDVHLTFTAIDVGDSHSCGITTVGTAYCWGFNADGELGDGTTTARAAPVPVAGDLRFSSISAGRFHTCGLTAAGSAWCWGLNASAQLGNGGNASSAVPVQVSGAAQFTSVSAGGAHTCALAAGGVAYCWGANDDGELGDGSTTGRSTPTLVKSDTAFATISAGRTHTCGVSTAGPTLCWGSNASGQLGHETPLAGAHPLPLVVARAARFAVVTAGATHSCGFDVKHAGFCWGDNANGELGDSSDASRALAVPIVGSLRLVGMSAGVQQSCGVADDGSGYCWGANSSGALGDGTTTDRDVPTRVATSVKFSVISTGASHACALTPTGAVYCWGANDSGQLGNGSSSGSLSAMRIIQ